MVRDETTGLAVKIEQARKRGDAMHDKIYDNTTGILSNLASLSASINDPSHGLTSLHSTLHEPSTGLISRIDTLSSTVNADTGLVNRLNRVDEVLFTKETGIQDKVHTLTVNNNQYGTFLYGADSKGGLRSRMHTVEETVESMSDWSERINTLEYNLLNTVSTEGVVTELGLVSRVDLLEGRVLGREAVEEVPGERGIVQLHQELQDKLFRDGGIVGSLQADVKGVKGGLEGLEGEIQTVKEGLKVQTREIDEGIKDVKEDIAQATSLSKFHDHLVKPESITALFSSLAWQQPQVINSLVNHLRTAASDTSLALAFYTPDNVKLLLATPSVVGYLDDLLRSEAYKREIQAVSVESLIHEIEDGEQLKSRIQQVASEQATAEKIVNKGKSKMLESDELKDALAEGVHQLLRTDDEAADLIAAVTISEDNIRRVSRSELNKDACIEHLQEQDSVELIGRIAEDWLNQHGIKVVDPDTITYTGEPAEDLEMGYDFRGMEQETEFYNESREYAADGDLVMAGGDPSAVPLPQSPVSRSRMLMDVEMDVAPIDFDLNDAVPSPIFDNDDLPSTAIPADPPSPLAAVSAVADTALSAPASPPAVTPLPLLSHAPLDERLAPSGPWSFSALSAVPSEALSAQIWTRDWPSAAQIERLASCKFTWPKKARESGFFAPDYYRQTVLGRTVFSKLDEYGVNGWTADAKEATKRTVLGSISKAHQQKFEESLGFNNQLAQHLARIAAAAWEREQVFLALERRDSKKELSQWVREVQKRVIKVIDYEKQVLELRKEGMTVTFDADRYQQGWQGQ
ncbi:hypothetical protein IAR55_004223 [Kwoniella newhampshirensis]|uniref:Transcription activator GCR1-like domain-containing protein n=1 Tax=Kwoniella newhampshirensis TaxID=1651941 RepID=A0AAW0YM12_9TREE